MSAEAQTATGAQGALAAQVPAPIEGLAAVDLGSNSFHMIVARPVGDGWAVIDRLRQRVGLAEGLDESGWLEEEAQERALACLAQFGQRLRELHPDKVRAVGTNTLRAARNSDAFRERARATLGHPIEVISGAEEARLIYAGVAHDQGIGEERRLVVDIGGGSTELILGQGSEPSSTESLHMGHLSWKRRHFADGRITLKRFQAAQRAARVELEPIERPYRHQGWEQCIASSGTALAVESVLTAQGWCQGGISRDGLERLRDELCRVGRASKLQLDGLREDRKPVIAGGAAILLALFEGLRLEHMAVSDGALREGVLHDMLGRLLDDDTRDRTIERLCQSYHVDLEHARRVESTALALLEQACDAWGLADVEHGRLLSWAARLHEIGMALSHSSYHKHGAYLVRNSDLPGFSRQDQRCMAAMILCHRRKLRQAAFDELSPERRRPVLRLSLILRLAVVLHRGRSRRELPLLKLEFGKHKVALEFPDGWLDAHALTRDDLQTEAEIWSAAGLRLRLPE